MDSPRAFSLTTPDGALDVLRDRLRGARRPGPPLGGAGWDLGTDGECYCSGRSRRPWAERTSHIVHWTEMPRGGHVGPFEEPELYAEDLRVFFRPYRGG